MRLSSMLAIATVAAIPVIGTGAGVAPCAAPAYHQFDFWVGRWQVEQEILGPDGAYARFPATDRVERAAGGCAIVEHWQGLVRFSWEGMTAPDSLYGLSVRSYDTAHERWSISWLDSRHPAFGEPFVGTFTGARGTFLRRAHRAEGAEALTQIVFERVGADRVEWSLSVPADSAGSWTTVWRMHFHRTP
jgi:hypothetical protein